jgi:cytochrome oxidase Cu insertion factor (SCO1/SenC/PrrC family)
MIRAILALLVFSAFSVNGMTPAEKKAMTGTPAPDFSYTTLDGKQKKLSDLKGTPVVLVFAYTQDISCPLHVDLWDHLKESSEKSASYSIPFIIVSMTPPRESHPSLEFVSRKLAGQKIEGVADSKRTTPQISDGYKVRGLVSYCVVDAEGNIALPEIRAKKPELPNILARAAELAAVKK